MSASIGAMSFDFLLPGSQSPMPLANDAEDFARSGLDGQGVKILGKRGGGFQWVLRKYVADTSAYATFLASLLSLRATITTWIDDHSLTYSNVKVDDIQLTEPKFVISNGSNALMTTVTVRGHLVA